MIRLDAVWLAVEPLDMRAGTESALARVVAVVRADPILTQWVKFRSAPTGELFRDESALMKRLLALRSEIFHRVTPRTENDSGQVQLLGFGQRVDALRQKIVATTEGGAITGEERLREHTDQLYGALLAHEGRPTVYQLSNIDVLRAEFKQVNQEFERLVGLDLAALNRSLVTAGMPVISVLPDDNDRDGDDDVPGSSNPAAGRGDPDFFASPSLLPFGFRPMR